MNQKAIQHSNNERIEETIPGQPFHVMGLNDNLDFLGTRLHIQTENAKHPIQCIVTQVFSKGRIVFSKKSEYPAGLCATKNPDKIQELMRMQHFQVIQDISDKQKCIQDNPKI
jgi:hypothetical protein